jgi:hypothetical protein
MNVERVPAFLCRIVDTMCVVSHEGIIPVEDLSYLDVKKPRGGLNGKQRAAGEARRDGMCRN